MPTLASGLRISSISSQLGPVETIPQTHRGPHSRTINDQECSGSREGAEEDEARPRQSGGQCAEDRLANRVSWSGFRGIRRQRRTTVRAAQPKSGRPEVVAPTRVGIPGIPELSRVIPGTKLLIARRGATCPFSAPAANSVTMTAESSESSAASCRGVLSRSLRASRSAPAARAEPLSETTPPATCSREGCFGDLPRSAKPSE